MWSNCEVNFVTKSLYNLKLMPVSDKYFRELDLEFFHGTLGHFKDYRYKAYNTSISNTTNTIAYWN